MKNSFGNTRRIASGMLAAALAVMVAAPAEAQPLHRNQYWQRHNASGYGRHDTGHRYSSGWGAHIDGGLVLGILGLGLVAGAIADSQRPVVVYQPQPAYPYPEPYETGYPPPRRYYPECKEFVGNPGAMAFCEKGVLERENEEQRLLEQRAYEAGRGQ
jgi:hypothetical protein